jgi:hypothetical protein
MATKTFYATKDMKHPTYRTRMLRAGDELELDGPTARLFGRLGAISPTKPKGAKATVPAATTENVAATPPVTPPPAAPTATAPKRKAPDKRAKKRATAKK